MKCKKLAMGLELPNIWFTLAQPRDWSPLVWYKRRFLFSFEFNVKWGGAKVPPFLWHMGRVSSLSPIRSLQRKSWIANQSRQYSSSLKKKSSFEG